MGTAFSFDATTVDPTSSFDPLPNGKYRVHATESEVKPTNKGDGRYMQIVWEVLDGPYKGRKLWDRINVENPNATCQEIGQRALSAVCHATGVLRLSHSSQLLHRPVMLTVVVKEGDVKKGPDGKPLKDAQDNVVRYDPRNEVKKYEAVEGGPGVPLPKHGTTAHGGERAAAVTGTPVAAGGTTPTPVASRPAWAGSAR